MSIKVSRTPPPRRASPRATTGCSHLFISAAPRLPPNGSRGPRLTCNYSEASRATASPNAWRLKALSFDLDRDRPPLEFGLRITTFIRHTRGQAWRDAKAKVAKMARIEGSGWHDHRRIVTEGQQRVFDLQAQGDVLDENLYTTPGKFGAGGAATTRLVGEAEDVASSGSCCPIRPFYRKSKGRSHPAAAAAGGSRSRLAYLEV
jgi:hypothetical protein